MRIRILRVPNLRIHFLVAIQEYFQYTKFLNLIENYGENRFLLKDLGHNPPFHIYNQSYSVKKIVFLSFAMSQDPKKDLKICILTTLSLIMKISEEHFYFIFFTYIINHIK